MGSRADERDQRILYKGHPPYCSCVDCQKERKRNNLFKKTATPKGSFAYKMNPLKSRLSIIRPKEEPSIPPWAKKMLGSKIFWIAVSLAILYWVIHTKESRGWAIATIVLLGISSAFSFWAFLIFFSIFVALLVTAGIFWANAAMVTSCIILFILAIPKREREYESEDSETHYIVEDRTSTPTLFNKDLYIPRGTFIFLK